MSPFLSSFNPRSLTLLLRRHEAKLLFYTNYTQVPRGSGYTDLDPNILFEINPNKIFQWPDNFNPKPTLNERKSIFLHVWKRSKVVLHQIYLKKMIYSHSHKFNFYQTSENYFIKSDQPEPEPQKSKSLSK